LLDVQNRIHAHELSDAERFQLLKDWLKANQPCLFGRVASKHDRLSGCVLVGDDLNDGDEAVRDKIQRARLQWRRDGFRGLKSGFVITALTPTLTTAAPDATMCKFAAQLCQLYLNTEVHLDTVHHDTISVKEDDEHALVWKVGVNFFASAGDGRWWHDHRVPGGIALSMNSVGHMTKSTKEWVTEFSTATKVAKSTPDTLSEALRLAVQTIHTAHEACSGKATNLRARTMDDGCPHADLTWPQAIKDKNRRTYDGWYHTDFTIPTLYFRPDQFRPADAAKQDLDFSYLWDDSVDDPDHQTMAKGERVPR